MTAPRLGELVRDFAASLRRVDRGRPIWRSSRSGIEYLPGIGPYPETEAVRLIAADLMVSKPIYASLRLGVPYPASPRQRCDIVLGDPATWAVEVKLLRLLGDNGKPNDNMLMHVLSPYPAHRSALTDVEKLARSGFDARHAVLIYGFDYDDWPMDPAIEAFELLAKHGLAAAGRAEAEFAGLSHPVQQRGRVFAWEVLCRTQPR